MASLSLQHVYKKYDGGVVAVSDFNLEIADKEFVILVGPSGCGKSTTLRMIAGLEDITEGEIYIDNRIVNDVLPKDRDIAMVFQNYALYPHMTVFDNMAFGLKLRKTPKEEIKKRVHEAARILSIEHLLDRKPKALSGGQRQRVALGRAIVREPKVFLMDEPLSNLDAKLRIQTRAELIRLHRSLGITTIYVTHDQVEAMTMGQRIAVMKDGLLQQCAEPETVYHKPANKFVAGFIGSPPLNFLEAKIQGGKVVVGKLAFPLKDDHPAKAMEGKDITLGIRPETIYDATLNNQVPATEQNSFTAKVDVLEPLGPEYTAYLFVDGINLLATIDSSTKIQEGKESKFCVNLDQIHLFDAETEEAIR